MEVSNGTISESASAALRSDEAVAAPVVSADYLVASAFPAVGVVVPNAEEAMKWYRLAASGGNVQAKKNIGDLYVAATVPPNCKDKLSGAVSLGCFWVADPNDNAKFLDAMKWYQEAALAGHAGAMTNIGWLYASGYGVKQDCGLAKQWLVKAAAGGNQSAVNNLKSGIGRCSW
jgi:uncharacterized protein